MAKEWKKCPIILMGCQRSGTTLLSSILSAHPKLFAIPKEVWVPYHCAKNQDFTTMKKDYEDRLNECKAEIKKKPDAVRWLEKTPNNITYISEILEQFESNLKLIHIIRDGRDVVTSIHPRVPLHRPYTKWGRWVGYVRNGLEYKDHLTMLTIKYEDLILDYENTVKKICDHIEEDFVDELKDWFKHATHREDLSYNGVVKPMHSNSVYKWKDESKLDEANKEYLAECLAEPKFTDLLKELEYEV